MPVYLYDDRKVPLRRPHRNGDVDSVGASYTRRKANVTEALAGWFESCFVDNPEDSFSRDETQLIAPELLVIILIHLLP